MFGYCKCMCIDVFFFQIHEFSCLFILLPLSCSVSAFRFWQSIELLSKETGKRFFIDKSQAFPNFRVDKSASKWFRLAVLKISVDVPVRCAHQMLVARLGHNVKLVDPCVGFGYVVTNAGQNLVVIDARTPWHSKWMEVILLPFTCWYVPNEIIFQWLIANWKFVSNILPSVSSPSHSNGHCRSVNSHGWLHPSHGAGSHDGHGTFNTRKHWGEKVTVTRLKALGGGFQKFGFGHGFGHFNAISIALESFVSRLWGGFNNFLSNSLICKCYFPQPVDETHQKKNDHAVGRAWKHETIWHYILHIFEKKNSSHWAMRMNMQNQFWNILKSPICYSIGISGKTFRSIDLWKESPCHTNRS